MTATSVERVNGSSVPEPRPDPRAVAEAEAIRERAAAEAEAARIKAEGEKAKALQQAEELRLANEKQAVANERAALRFQRERSELLAKTAEADRKREESERAAAKARREEEAEEKAVQSQAAEVAAVEDKWRAWAIRFAVVCAIVSLPVQMSAFWNRDAPWMVAAPIMLEGGAWVVHRGAAAAVANRRPVWHYRAIVWLLALVAAAVNLYHGLAEFDPGTAFGTAFASIAGPGVWDLHEHGRIRKQEGALTRRQRKAQEKAAKAEAARKAAEEKKRAEEKKAADEAAAQERRKLDEKRASDFPEVWAHAVKLAAALGETTVTEPVWIRAHIDIEGCKPGETYDVIAGRQKAEKRVEALRASTPASRVEKHSNTQRASQVPDTKKPRVYNPPAQRGVRTKGDTARYVAAARKQASIAAKNAATKDQ